MVEIDWAETRPGVENPYLQILQYKLYVKWS